MQGDFGMDGLVVDWRLDLMVTREVMHRRQDRGRIADVQQGHLETGCQDGFTL